MATEIWISPDVMGHWACIETLPLPPQKRLEFPERWVGCCIIPKTLKKCVKFNWKNPFCGEVWIFSGTAQRSFRVNNLQNTLVMAGLLFLFS